MTWAVLGALRARRLPAAAGVVVWLSGMTLLPFFHNIGHRNDHTHAGPTHSHSHPTAHAHPHPHDGVPSSNDPEREPLDPEHGQGSLLHFAAVAVGEAPALIPRLMDSLVPGPSVHLHRVHTPTRISFLARGPPAG